MFFHTPNLNELQAIKIDVSRKGSTSNQVSKKTHPKDIFFSHKKSFFSLEIKFLDISLIFDFQRCFIKDLYWISHENL